MIQRYITLFSNNSTLHLRLKFKIRFFWFFYYYYKCLPVRSWCYQIFQSKACKYEVIVERFFVSCWEAHMCDVQEKTQEKKNRMRREVIDINHLNWSWKGFFCCFCSLLQGGVNLLFVGFCSLFFWLMLEGSKNKMFWSLFLRFTEFFGRFIFDLPLQKRNWGGFYVILIWVKLYEIVLLFFLYFNRFWPCFRS